MGIFERFLKLPIDFSCIGLEQREDAGGYFCTPKGARVIGHTGVDGIHFCCIRKYGEMVFAVSPMNDAPYVRPVAATFADFLGLLIACGSVDALEQAWMFDEAAFDAYVSENKPDEQMKAALELIQKELDIPNITDPYGYLYEIREDFHYDGIPFTAEYYDTLGLPLPEQKPKEWAVYYDGNFWGHHGRSKPGKEIRLDKTFDWEGEHWHIPAAYACSKGLVIDLCLSAEKAQVQAYLDKVLSLSEEEAEDRYEQLEAANPLHADFRARLLLNGKPLRQDHGSAVTYYPDDCIPLGERGSEEAEVVVEHYDLDREKGWLCWRMSFLWATKTVPSISRMVLTLISDPGQVGSFSFTTPGEQEIRFTHPITKVEHTLTVHQAVKDEIDASRFGSQEYIFPTHITQLGYTVSPEIEQRNFQIRDTAKADPVKQRPREQGFYPEATGAASIGIIGGADGPVAVFAAGMGGPMRTAVSAMRYQPQDRVDWKAVILAKPKQDVTVVLL